MIVFVDAVLVFVDEFVVVGVDEFVLVWLDVGWAGSDGKDRITPCLL